MRRMTPQRAAVAEVLDEIEEFRSAQQIHEHLRERGSAVGLATVYRTLQALAEADEVDTTRTADGEALYRRCARREHHHHIICRECGATVEIDGPPVEAWAEQIGRSLGYRDIEHTLELVGTCTDCARAAGATPVTGS